jgi:hypothetical protein
MKIKIFQIGGNNPEGFLGEARADFEAMSLIRKAEDARASGVSLHGTLPHLREAVSGEFTISEAKTLIHAASDAVTAFIMDGIDPAMAGDMD